MKIDTLLNNKQTNEDTQHYNCRSLCAHAPLSSFVSMITFIIVGDFNVHVCCETRPLVKDFFNLIDSLNLTQSISEPTHDKGHILDLVTVIWTGCTNN